MQLLEAQLAVELSSLVSWRCWLLEALFAWFALADVVFQKSDHHSIKSFKGVFEDDEEEQAQLHGHEFDNMCLRKSTSEFFNNDALVIQ
jgi:hypothetical protein